MDTNLSCPGQSWYWVGIVFAGQGICVRPCSSVLQDVFQQCVGRIFTSIVVRAMYNQ